MPRKVVTDAECQRSREKRNKNARLRYARDKPIKMPKVPKPSKARGFVKMLSEERQTMMPVKRKVGRPLGSKSKPKVRVNRPPVKTSARRKS